MELIWLLIALLFITVSEVSYLIALEVNMKKIIVSMFVVMFLSGCAGPWFGQGGHQGGGGQDSSRPR